MKKLIYVYDALCGWCFGFSPVMRSLTRDYPAMPVEVVSGGLISGERIGPIGKVAPYIRQAYKDVEEACGVRFGEAFVNGGLADGSMRMNSIPPAVAMVIFRERFPERQLEFAHSLHQMIYVHGHSPEDNNALASTAAALGYPEGEFAAKLGEHSYEDAARRDFLRAQQLQVSGFPGLLAEAANGELYLLARGYTPYEALLPRLQQVTAIPA